MKKLKPIKINNVWRKTGGICAHCGNEVPTHSRTIDHFVPKAQGGTWDTRNLMPLCVTCNQIRGSRWINPKTFYCYAPGWVIRDCFEYRREFLKSRTNMDGEVMVAPKPKWEERAGGGKK